MRYEAHVGLVYTHAEGDGGDHDNALFAYEAALVFEAHGSIESSVVGQGIPSLFLKPCGGFFYLLA